MSSEPGRTRGAGRSLDSGQAADILAVARKAFFVMVGVLVVLWAIQIVNWADSYRLSYEYGIKPHDIAGLPYILTAPFLHFSWTHIEGNSGPLFIFGFLAAYRGIGKFTGVTLIVMLTSGLAAWFFEASGSVGAGASGVVFGYFGYIMVRGLFDRHGIDVLIGAVMALCFAYQFSVLVPQQGIGWQAHVGGLVGGILAGWLLRDRSRARAAKASAPKASAPKASAAKSRRATAPPAPAAAGAATSTAIEPAKGKAAKKFTVPDDNPRADLYKQLDDLGL
jgi:membrane associated rhomboid family serine protease